MKPEKMTAKTQTLVVHPISSAVREAELFLKRAEKITAVNDTQKKFLDKIYTECKKDASRIKEIESIADIDNEKINEWLRKRGFQIKLGPFGPGGFGVASALDILGKWAVKGKKWSVKTEEGEYFPGVKMTNYGVKFYRVEEFPSLIIEIETKEGDRVHLMMVDEVPSGLALLDFVEQIHKEKKSISPEHDGVVFPKIDLDEETVLEWIIGLRFETSKEEQPYYTISQALQQTKLKMNEIGFRVKSAVALGVLAGAPPKRTEPYVINKPFLMWITRLGLSKPLFIGYLNKDVWKDPQGLDM